MWTPKGTLNPKTVSVESPVTFGELRAINGRTIRVAVCVLLEEYLNELFLNAKSQESLCITYIRYR